jgi:hypothetical protein
MAGAAHPAERRPARRVGDGTVHEPNAEPWWHELWLPFGDAGAGPQAGTTVRVRRLPGPPPRSCVDQMSVQLTVGAELALPLREPRKPKVAEAPGASAPL